MKLRMRRAVRSLGNTKSAVLVAALAAMAVAAYWGGKRLFVLVYAETPINVRPYVMDYDSIVVHGAVETVVGHTTESRRHDGATHTVGIHYAASPDQLDAVFRRVDLPDGTTAMISDAIHAKSSARRPAADQAQLNQDVFFDRTAPDCTSKNAMGEKVEGTDILLGYTALRISTLTGKDEASRLAGLLRVVAWRLPDFNCVIAQDFSQTRSSNAGEWKTTEGNRLTAFAAREPDPALFTNWLNYDEMKPSDLGRKLALARGLTPETCPRCFAPDPSDANYRKWRNEEGK